MADWRTIESAPREPVSTSLQSDWFRGTPHGPVVLLAFAHEGYEEWPAQIGWWSPRWECWRFLEDDGPDDVQPTHWMHLPVPPGASKPYTAGTGTDG